MLRLYLIRNAEAEKAPEGSRFGDPLRGLTAKGRRRFRRTARRFVGLDETVDAICTSPLLRAVQTAELFAAALSLEEVRVLDELRADGTASALLTRLGELNAGAVAVVGHKRLLLDVAAQLTGVASAEAASLHLKHGAIARIDVRALGAEPSGKARWWLRPSTGSLRAGLPFDAVTAS